MPAPLCRRQLLYERSWKIEAAPFVWGIRAASRKALIGAGGGAFCNIPESAFKSLSPSIEHKFICQHLTYPNWYVTIIPS